MKRFTQALGQARFSSTWKRERYRLPARSEVRSGVGNPLPEANWVTFPKGCCQTLKSLNRDVKMPRKLHLRNETGTAKT